MSESIFPLQRSVSRAPNRYPQMKLGSTFHIYIYTHGGFIVVDYPAAFSG